jgi:hypothetical protein
MLSRILFVGAALAAGCATAASEPVDEAAAEKLAEFARTGQTTTCLSVARISEIRAVDEKTLLIRSGVNEYYVSDLPSRCNGVTRNSTRIEYTTSTADLCRGEILRIVDNSAGFLTGSCGMGSFEKLAPKPPAE